MRKSSVAVLAVGVLMGAALPAAHSAQTARPKASPPVERVEAAPGDYPMTWQWKPADITISAGDAVRWENPTNETHRIASWDGDWDVVQPLAPGASAKMRFKEPGVYSYFCSGTYHADIVYLLQDRFCVGMCGTITVE